MKIYIDTDLNNTTEMQKYFTGHDATHYTGSLKEAQEEMQYWIISGWAVPIQTEKYFEKITPVTMKALIKEFVL